jgi:hypothetical protein
MQEAITGYCKEGSTSSILRCTAVWLHAPGSHTWLIIDFPAPLHSQALCVARSCPLPRAPAVFGVFNLLCRYDFFVYSMLNATLSKVFFPSSSDNPTVQQISFWGV